MSAAEDTDHFVAIARMGIDAETFIKTPLGKFLREKALTEVADATEALIDADPEDVKLNRELRNQIHVARMFLVWMTDAINAGLAAHHQLQEMDDLARTA